jgi:S1-C subfamily serine protease
LRRRLLPAGALLMTRKWMTGAFACLLACGAAMAQPEVDSPAGSGASPAIPNTVKLAKVVVDLPAGTPWLSLRQGTLFCIREILVRTWGGGKSSEKLSAFSPPFKTELERAGYKVVTPNEDNLFDPGSGSADYEVAAVITDEHVKACMRNPGLLNESIGEIRGEASMNVDWQVYSPIRKQVVARLSTSATAKLDDSVQGGIQKLAIAAFAENVRQLASTADFRAALTAPRPFSAGFQMPGQQSKIVLAGSLKAGPRKIADAAGSVVTILNKIGSGSGVLVSTDGYVITDAHVVGDDKEARVRWSDGIETLGQVVRVAKNRDVAIIKTNPRDRSPLAIKRGRVTPGQRVYAIGSPRGKEFEGTVSSGVISADRVMDGLRYIQSDTTVSHGSSGGPLLDESGAVIGLTDLGFDNDGPAGLNLFTPIGDAMDFLSLEQQ